ncbi:MAG TPA: hypothetical protein VHT02_01700, partial [Methylocella sp.]|nr:hypothetical protein [Methylocella sp.]
SAWRVAPFVFRVYVSDSAFQIVFMTGLSAIDLMEFCTSLSGFTNEFCTSMNGFTNEFSMSVITFMNDKFSMPLAAIVAMLSMSLTAFTMEEFSMSLSALTTGLSVISRR